MQRVLLVVCPINSCVRVALFFLSCFVHFVDQSFFFHLVQCSVYFSEVFLLLLLFICLWLGCNIATASEFGAFVKSNGVQRTSNRLLMQYLCIHMKIKARKSLKLCNDNTNANVQDTSFEMWKSWYLFRII